MPNALIQPSFSSGEVSPNLSARTDVNKFHTSCLLAQNLFVDYRGGLSSRAGTRFVTQTKIQKQVRLIPFTFNVEQTYVLEFGDQYMRVIANGGLVLEPAQVTITGVTQASTAVVTQPAHGYFGNQWVELDGIVGMEELNGRTFLMKNVTVDTYELWLPGQQTPVSSTDYGAYVSGGSSSRIYTMQTPYDSDLIDLRELKYTQSNDVLTVTHPLYQPADITRTGNAAWTYTPISFKATVGSPSGVDAATTQGGSIRYGYCVTAVDEGGQEGSPSPVRAVNSKDKSDAQTTITVTWNKVTGADYYNIFGSTASRGSSDIPVGTQLGYLGSAFGLQFLDSNVTPNFARCPPTHRDPFAVSRVRDIHINNGGTGYDPNTSASINDPNGSGAVVLPIVIGGIIQGFIVQSGGQGYTNPSVNLSGTGGGTGFNGDVKLSPDSGTWPSCVNYFQQRKYYAATLNQPNTLWGSKPGTFNNFDTSQPTLASDALTFTLASREVNAIKHLLSMPSGLVILTSGGAWQLTGNAAQHTAIDPTNALADPQAYGGCADPIPIVINYDILYVQEKGNTVRDLSYNFFVNVYTGTDLTVLSYHLFDGFTIPEWTWAEQPHKTVLCVRSDGKILALTFMKEQELTGWAWWQTAGMWQSICSIREGDHDAVYMVVQRNVGGQLLQYIERLQQRSSFDLGVDDAWCLDCALRTPGTRVDATLTPSAISGDVVYFNTAERHVFTAADVGKTLRARGGIALIDAYIDGNTLQGHWTRDQQVFLPEENTPLTSESGTWTLNPLVSHLGGLWHLIGKEVWALADGSVQGPFVVDADGGINLTVPATKVLVGLKFVADFRSQYMDSPGGPTIQGKRKAIHAVTVRMVDTLGIKIGSSFERLTEIKERNSQPLDSPLQLVTGDRRVVMDPNWQKEGVICIRQENPLPMTLTALIPEVTVGDISGQQG